MILELAGCIQIVTGQPNKPPTMHSVVCDETNQETLKVKNLQKERQINKRDPYKTEVNWVKF